MEIERQVDSDGRIAMRAYEWDMSQATARKGNRHLIGYDTEPEQ